MTPSAVTPDPGPRSDPAPTSAPPPHPALVPVPAPAAVVVAGCEWTIERVWPPRGSDPGRPLEASHRGMVRGGYIDTAGAVELLAPGEDPRLPALGETVAHGRLISHRPGRRAVVRLDSGDGYAKVVPRKRAPRIAEAHERGRVFSAGLRVPTVVPTELDSASVVCFSPLRGRSFSEIGADAELSDSEWGAAWRSWAEGWLAAAACEPPSDLPVHDVAEETAVLREWALQGADVLGGPVLRTAERVAAGLEAASAPSALSHRDLHDGQLLWHPDEGVGLIDLDTCARADPALDLGNLAAHVEFAVHQGHWPRERAETALIALADVAAALGIDATRLTAWRTASLLRVACVNALRPPRRSVAQLVWERIEAEMSERT